MIGKQQQSREKENAEKGVAEWIGGREGERRVGRTGEGGREDGKR